MIQAMDGSYIISGSWSFLARVTPEGSLSWLKYWYQDGYDHYANSIAQLSDSGLVITGSRVDLDYVTDVFIQKFKSNGSLSTCLPGVCVNGLGEYSIVPVSIRRYPKT